MKIRVTTGEKEKIVNLNFWDLLKIYLLVSVVATLIFLIVWIVVLLIMFLL